MRPGVCGANILTTGWPRGFRRVASAWPSAWPLASLVYGGRSSCVTLCTGVTSGFDVAALDAAGNGLITPLSSCFLCSVDGKDANSSRHTT
eukprot:scaffold256185_cov36-Tisochrysis_lutea.AAC.2